MFASLENFMYFTKLTCTSFFFGVIITTCAQPGKKHYNSCLFTFCLGIAGIFFIIYGEL